MPSGRVSLFVTCIVDQVFAKVGFAMADVLERAGYKLDFPPAQTCCGQPAFNSGYRESSRQVARHFLDVFRHSEYIVVPSGSCTAMISHHYDDIFENDPEMRKKARDIGARVHEFSQFLLEVAKVDDVGARYDATVTYHDSCHALRELKIKDGPRRLLANVKGLTLLEMEAAQECCGFGGTSPSSFPRFRARWRAQKWIPSSKQERAPLFPSIRAASCNSKAQSAAPDCRSAPCTLPKFSRPDKSP
jgi:L-lactate dehydrogenase complex protein LldE